MKNGDRVVSSLAEAVAAAGAPPCDTCAHYRHCASQEHACDRFGLYVYYGADLVPWRNRLRREVSRLADRAENADRPCARSKAKASLRARTSELDRLEAALQPSPPPRRPDRRTFLRIMLGAPPGPVPLPTRFGGAS